MKKMRDGLVVFVIIAVCARYHSVTINSFFGYTAVVKETLGRLAIIFSVYSTVVPKFG